jgi:AcrR family transcriptional regulator
VASAVKDSTVVDSTVVDSTVVDSTVVDSAIVDGASVDGTIVERPATPPRRANAPRRTQVQRSSATRRALLAATVQALVDLGYSRTTTTEVCSRAGVSQGALFRHFPTKQALVAASVEHLYGNLLQSFEEELGSIDRDIDRDKRDLPEALVTLWHTFERPELAAAYELHVAARTDPELRDRLATVTSEHAASVRDTARSLFPAIASDERFDPLLDTVLEAFQGMTISRMVAPDSAHEVRVLETLQHLARETFQTEDAR